MVTNEIEEGVRTDLQSKAEEAAVRFLEKRGYDILERSWVCPAGVAAIIALDESAIVFIDVQVSTDIEEGYPDEDATSESRRCHEIMAAYYLQSAEVEPDTAFRFDSISILALGNGQAALRHHINAFS